MRTSTTRPTARAAATDRTTRATTGASRARAPERARAAPARAREAQPPRDARLLAGRADAGSAGDEIGRTQRGNNNAYCQDDETELARLAARSRARARCSTSRGAPSRRGAPTRCWRRRRHLDGEPGRASPCLAAPRRRADAASRLAGPRAALRRAAGSTPAAGETEDERGRPAVGAQRAPAAQRRARRHARFALPRPRRRRALARGARQRLRRGRAAACAAASASGGALAAAARAPGDAMTRRRQPAARRRAVLPDADELARLAGGLHPEPASPARRARRHAGRRGRLRSCAPSTRTRSRAECLLEDARAGADDPRRTRRGLFALLPARRRPAAALPPALPLRRRPRAGSATTRTASCRRSASSTCTCSPRARTAGSGRCSARVRCASTASTASPSRSGRRTRRACRVVGDFCGWDGRLLPDALPRRLGRVRALRPGRARRARSTSTRSGRARARCASRPIRWPLRWRRRPARASRVVAQRATPGATRDWMRARRATAIRAREPLAIYEVHLGSWARVPRGAVGSLAYREIAPRARRSTCARSASPTSSCCRWRSTRSTARGAIR